MYQTVFVFTDNTYRVIEGEKKNWCQAQQYCRTHFSDLASIRNETENQRVIEMGGKQTFWIGLMHDQWQWENGICSTYRNWNTVILGNCSCQLLASGELMQQDQCTFNKKVLCTQGNTFN